MSDGLVVSVEVGDLKLNYPEAYFRELIRIIKEGPIFENEISIKGLAEKLFINRLIVKVVVGNYHEKIAATKLGSKVCLAFEDSIAMMKLSNTTTLRTTDFNSEVTQLINYIGQDKS